MTTPLSAPVTGWAWRTPLGHDVDAAMNRWLAGEHAIVDNPRFDARTYACTKAAPILDEPAKSRHSRVLRPMGLFAIEVAREALEQSGAPTGDGLGLFAAIGGLRAHWNDLMPALREQNDDLTDSWNRGFKLFHPFWMLQHLSNNAHALLSAEIEARGEGVTMGGANAGAQALAAAIRALAAGAIEHALVVAYDTLIEPETVTEMASRGALDNETCVPGEAAAAVVLTRLEDGGRALVEAADGSGAVHTLTPAPIAELAPAMGDIGAATAVVQVIAITRMLEMGKLDGRAAIGVSGGAPSLIGAVRVEIPR